MCLLQIIRHILCNKEGFYYLYIYANEELKFHLYAKISFKRNILISAPLLMGVAKSQPQSISKNIFRNISTFLSDSGCSRKNAVVKIKTYLHAFHTVIDKEMPQELFDQTIILFYHRYHFQIFCPLYSA